MEALIDRFIVEVATTKTDKTFREYRRLGEIAKPIFSEFSPDQVRPVHIAQVVDHEAKKAPTQANRLRQFLSAVFSFGVRTGAVESNPCRDVHGIKVMKRERYITDEEFNKVKGNVTVTISRIMECCYYTGQRIGDVLKVRKRDITKAGIAFVQGKTGSRLVVKMTPSLKAIVKHCGDEYLFESRRGMPYSYFGVSAMFRRGCKAAGVEDFHIHDIRAKALTDAHNQGRDAQKLGGHRSRAMTDQYVKARSVEVVEPPKRRKS